MFGFLTALAFATTAVFQAQAALPANCDRNATVGADEDCNSISIMYNVSTYQLATANAGVIDQYCSNLFPGEVICLGLQGQDCNTTYVVQSGDTCLEIAYAFNIPESTLLANNPNVNLAGTNLYVDEVLCVSSTIYVNSTGSS